MLPKPSIAPQGAVSNSPHGAAFSSVGAPPRRQLQPGTRYRCCEYARDPMTRRVEPCGCEFIGAECRVGPRPWVGAGADLVTFAPCGHIVYAETGYARTPERVRGGVR